MQSFIHLTNIYEESPISSEIKKNWSKLGRPRDSSKGVGLDLSSSRARDFAILVNPSVFYFT